MILVSACLLGCDYRYNGGDNYIPALERLLRDRDVRQICPEVDGGLSVPRPPAEIKNGDGFDVLAGKARVITETGKDVTDFYIAGSKKMLTGIASEQIDFAVMKSKSPACGLKSIYSGEFNNRLKSGSGVGTAFLQKHGITVFTEIELDKISKMLANC